VCCSSGEHSSNWARTWASQPAAADARDYVALRLPDTAECSREGKEVMPTIRVSDGRAKERVDTFLTFRPARLTSHL